MSKELKKTVFMMGIGIVIYELFLMLLALFIYKHIGYSLLSLELGILVGTFIEFIMLVDMAYVTVRMRHTQTGKRSYALS